ncbi:MAG: Ig-like domain-containing protein, partial [Elusimicrobiota bacterium]|nr:Ig-like domain-containing protein [Elusimicrobiota bacterium]
SVKLDGSLATGSTIYWATYTTWGESSGKEIVGLQPSTTYYFNTIARNGDGILTTWSGASSGTTLYESVPPGKITHLTALPGMQHGEVNLTWIAPGDDDYVGDVTGGAFEIKYSSTVNSQPSTAEYTLDKSSDYIQGQTQVLTITGLKPRTTYYFWVRARDEVISPPNWSVWSDTATAIPMIDVTPPEVDCYWPADNSVGIAISTQIVVEFSEEMNTSTISSETIKVEAVRDNLYQRIEPPEVVTTNVTYQNKFAIISINSLEYNYTYQVTITSQVKDLGGNSVKSTDKWKLIWVFTTIMNYTQPNVYVVAGDTGTQVDLKPDALPENGYVLCSTDPVKNPIRVGKETVEIEKIKQAIETANVKTEKYITDKFVVPETIREFNAYNSNNSLLTTKFNNKVTVTIPYRDKPNPDKPNGGNEGDKLVAGLSKRVKEKTLRMFYLDEKDNLWVRIPNSVVDVYNNKVTAEVSHFSVYTIMGSPDYDLSEAFAYPVPFEPNKYPEYHQFNKDKGITFTGLSDECIIRIYTITGELVKTIVHDSNAENSIKEVWDVCNESGEKVASEVYIYHISNEKQSKTGKLIIIR